MFFTAVTTFAMPLSRSKSYSVTKLTRAELLRRKNEERAARKAHAAQRHITSYLSEDTDNSWKIKLHKIGLEIRDIPADG